MSIFKKNNNETIIIVGCGRFGSTIATILSEQKKHVTVIDINKSAFRKLSHSFLGVFMQGDGSDVDLLVSSGAKNADIVIASTDNDNTNIMIAQIAKQVLGINKVCLRIFDTTKLVTLDHLDIFPICPTNLSVKEFERTIFSKEMDQQ